MLRIFPPLAALLLLVAAAPMPSTPPKWTVDAAKSSLTFAVKASGQTVIGKFPGFGALIVFAPNDLAHSSAKITMDMTGVKSGDAQRDAMLPQPDWFNVLDFPQSVFQTTSFVWKGGNKYIANGVLTMKGVRKPVALPFTLDIKGDTAVMKGETILKRLDFGVGKGPDFTDETKVSFSVKVMVNVTARRAK
jgi:polyisoprenoid-binding protein YceI